MSLELSHVDPLLLAKQVGMVSEDVEFLPMDMGEVLERITPPAELMALTAIYASFGNLDTIPALGVQGNDSHKPPNTDKLVNRVFLESLNGKTDPLTIENYMHSCLGNIRKEIAMAEADYVNKPSHLDEDDIHAIYEELVATAIGQSWVDLLVDNTESNLVVDRSNLIPEIWQNMHQIIRRRVTDKAELNKVLESIAVKKKKRESNEPLYPPLPPSILESPDYLATVAKNEELTSRREAGLPLYPDLPPSFLNSQEYLDTVARIQEETAKRETVKPVNTELVERLKVLPPLRGLAPTVTETEAYKDTVADIEAKTKLRMEGKLDFPKISEMYPDRDYSLDWPALEERDRLRKLHDEIDNDVLYSHRAAKVFPELKEESHPGNIYAQRMEVAKTFLEIYVLYELLTNKLLMGDNLISNEEYNSLFKIYTENIAPIPFIEGSDPSSPTLAHPEDPQRTAFTQEEYIDVYLNMLKSLTMDYNSPILEESRLGNLQKELNQKLGFDFWDISQNQQVYSQFNEFQEYLGKITNISHENLPLEIPSKFEKLAQLLYSKPRPKLDTKFLDEVVFPLVLGRKKTKYGQRSK